MWFSINTRSMTIKDWLVEERFTQESNHSLTDKKKTEGCKNTHN